MVNGRDADDYRGYVPRSLIKPIEGPKRGSIAPISPKSRKPAPRRKLAGAYPGNLRVPSAKALSWLPVLLRARLPAGPSAGDAL
jgi:hypothetical protein